MISRPTKVHIYCKGGYREGICTTSLASVTLAFHSNVALEEWSLLAVVQVLGLGDLEVLLVLANIITLGWLVQVGLENVLLLLLPFLFKFHGLVLGQGMHGVGSLAISKDCFLTGSRKYH